MTVRTKLNLHPLCLLGHDLQHSWSRLTVYQQVKRINYNQNKWQKRERKFIHRKSKVLITEMCTRGKWEVKHFTLQATAVDAKRCGI